MVERRAAKSYPPIQSWMQEEPEETERSTSKVGPETTPQECGFIKTKKF